MIQQLTVEGDDLRSTIETLKAELISSNDEAERATRELEALRTRSLHENAQESMLRERELRETQSELEKCRIERDEWERALMQERVLLNETRVSVDVLTRDLEMEQQVRLRDVEELGMERERASNLQSVLEDFQAGVSLLFSGHIPLFNTYAAKDHEIRQAVSEFETRYNEITVSLAEFKHRALTAEVRTLTAGYTASLLTANSCNSKRASPLRQKLRIWRRS